MSMSESGIPCDVQIVSYRAEVVRPGVLCEYDIEDPIPAVVSEKYKTWLRTGRKDAQVAPCCRRVGLSALTGV